VAPPAPAAHPFWSAPTLEAKPLLGDSFTLDDMVLEGTVTRQGLTAKPPDWGPHQHQPGDLLQPTASTGLMMHGPAGCSGGLADLALFTTDDIQTLQTCFGNTAAETATTVCAAEDDLVLRNHQTLQSGGGAILA